MGLHTGEAALVGDRYVGVAVHRAARIGAAARGGQVLISRITHDLLHDEEGELDGIRIRDLGQQRLRGLDRPVRLYQVAAADLPSEFPPLQTADREGAAAARSRRRTLAIAGAAVVLVAAAAVAAVFALTRGEPLPPVRPGSLVKLDSRTGDVLDVFPGAGGVGFVVATDEAVWVEDPDRRVLTRLDPSSGDAQQVGMDAGGISAGSNGRLWVAARNPARALLFGRQSLRAPLRTIDIDAPSVDDLAVADGKLWVVAPDSAVEGGTATLLRISLKSGEVDLRRPAGKTGWAIAYGYDAAWVANYEPGTVTRVGDDGLVSRIGVRNGPQPIAAGAGGVWVGHFHEPKLAKIDPYARAAGAVELIVTLRDAPSDLAVDDTAVWATLPCRREVVRLNPQTGDVVERVRLAATPFGIGLGAGGVWVTVGPPAEEC